MDRDLINSKHSAYKKCIRAYRDYDLCLCTISFEFFSRFLKIKHLTINYEALIKLQLFN